MKRKVPLKYIFLGIFWLIVYCPYAVGLIGEAIQSDTESQWYLMNLGYFTLFVMAVAIPHLIFIIITLHLRDKERISEQSYRITQVIGDFIFFNAQAFVWFVITAGLAVMAQSSSI